MTSVAAAPTPPPPLALNRKRTVAYFLYHLRMLPTAYDGLDTNRMTALYFCLSALDLLSALGHLEQPKEHIIEWIYSLQVLPTLPTVNAVGEGGEERAGAGVPTLPTVNAVNERGGREEREEREGAGEDVQWETGANRTSEAGTGGGAAGEGTADSSAGIPAVASGDTSTTADASATAAASWRRRLSPHPSAAFASDPACRDCGFIGSAFMGGERFDPATGAAVPDTAKGAVHGHIAMTYTALASLLILGDDLERVAREPILRAVRQLQQEDGRFVAHHRGGESDCRFLYCACAVAFMLGGVRTHMDVGAMRRYVGACVHGYDGAIGLIPGQESHGGACYTAVAGIGLCAEALGEALDVESDDIGLLEGAFAQWCLSRQVGGWSGDAGAGGFQGRVNKVADTCYTFWVLGALQVLDRGKLQGDSGGSGAKGSSVEWLGMYDADAIRSFLLDKDSGTHDHLRGGFGKISGALPDVLHSYYGVCGLALIGREEDAILPLDASLSISQRARSWLKEVQVRRGWV